MDPHVCSLLLDDASSPLFLLPIAYRRGGCRRGLVAAFPRLFLQFSFKLLSRLRENLDKWVSKQFYTLEKIEWPD